MWISVLRRLHPKRRGSDAVAIGGVADHLRLPSERGILAVEARRNDHAPGWARQFLSPPSPGYALALTMSVRAPGCRRGCGWAGGPGGGGEASRSSSRAFRAKAVMRAATFRPRNPMTVTPFVDRLIANGRIPRQVRLVLGSRIADPQPTLTEYMRVGRWSLANSRRCRSRISSGQECNSVAVAMRSLRYSPNGDTSPRAGGYLKQSRTSRFGGRMALLIIELDKHIGNAKAWRDTLKEQLPDLAIRIWPDAGELRDIEYLAFMHPDFDLLPVFPNLKAMFSRAAGVESFIKHPKLPKVPLGKVEPPSGDPMMTEYVIMHVLRFHRDMPA